MGVSGPMPHWLGCAQVSSARVGLNSARSWEDER